MKRTTANDLGVKEDIERRVCKATSVMGTLEGIWRNKTFDRYTKGKMMALYALPTGLYGDSNWALTRVNIKRLQRPSSATVSSIRRAGRLEAAGETETVVGATGKESTRSRCPLRCGWRWCQVMKHISSVRPLHPVTFKCTVCNSSFKTKLLTNNHIQDTCIGATIITEIREGNVYKWDNQAGFLVNIRAWNRPGTTSDAVRIQKDG